MPLKRCLKEGVSGWKWGDRGTCYTGPDAKKRALEQAAVIRASGFRDVLPITSARLKRLRRRAAKQRRSTTLRPMGIEPSRAVEARYYRELKNIVRELVNRVESQVVPLLEQIQFEYIQDSVFSAQRFIGDVLLDIEQTPVIAEQTQMRIAARMANSAEAFNRGRFIADINEAVGISLRGVITKEGVSGQVAESIETNVGLIKSIPEQYHQKLRGIINDGIERGDDAFSLRKQIKELGHVTERRARFIARDQTAKLNAAVTQTRQTKIGITHYFWRTTRDERVRPSHEAKEGNRYAWDDPPGDTGHPGQDFNCRCSADPDLSGLLDAAGAPELGRVTPKKLTEVNQGKRRRRKKK